MLMEFSLANPGINLTIPLFLPISSQLLKINKMLLPFSLPATPSVFFFFFSSLSLSLLASFHHPTPFSRSRLAHLSLKIFKGKFLNPYKVISCFIFL
jgi:hypothetical protein